MERSVAIKKLSRLLGKHLGWRINPKAATREEREVAKLELDDAIKERNTARDKRDARYKAILAADAEYQALHQAHKAAVEHANRLSSLQHSYKFTVGTTNGMFFLVKAQGDSWEEVIEKVSNERKAA